MKLGAAGESFDCFDVAAFAFDCEDEAGELRLAVDEHRAGAAFSELAAVEAARAIPGNSAERVRAVLRAHVHAMLDELEGATAHLEVELLPEALRRPLIVKRDRYERAVRELVTEGVARGEFAPCDASLVTRAMLGAVNWTARWYRPDGAQSVAQIADGLASYLVKGLA